MQQMTPVGEPGKRAGADEHGECNGADECGDRPKQGVGSLVTKKRPEHSGDDEDGEHRCRTQGSGCRSP